ncbi:MAG: PEP-CTERM sorting domain-containing protein [Bryobacteraceae bacterium]|jgi:hypothetical protein
MKRVLFAIGAVLAISGFATQAKAGLITFVGGDNAVTSLSQMTNSLAAEASWAAAVPGASVITFETALPAGVSVSGGSITNDSGCGALCGFNTTAGGAYFYLVEGGTATFTFTTPINAFGMYITGLQTDLVPQETLTFNDGSSETINTPASTGGGGAFVGFTDFGQSIVSVSYNATADVVSLDDVGYSSGAPSVPEPSYYIPLALLGVFAWARRRGIRVS